MLPAAIRSCEAKLVQDLESVFTARKEMTLEHEAWTSCWAFHLSADMGNEEGLSPLHCAALAGSTACTRLLLDAKADPQQAASDGRCSVYWVTTLLLARLCIGPYLHRLDLCGECCQAPLVGAKEALLPTILCRSARTTAQLCNNEVIMRLAGCPMTSCQRRAPRCARCSELQRLPKKALRLQSCLPGHSQGQKPLRYDDLNEQQCFYLD